MARRLSAGAAEMIAEVVEASHCLALERLPELLTEHVPRAGLRDVFLYMSDLQQETLHLLGGPPSTTTRAGELDALVEPLASECTTECGEPVALRIEGTLAGKAYQQMQILSKTAEDGSPEWWWVPLLDGTERLGVMRISAEEATEQTIEDVRCLASTVSMVVVSRRQHSDTYARLVRTRVMSVAAEMQWNLMPPLCFANHRVVVAAALEPAYDISGDALDYGMAGDTLHLVLCDAMGHDASAGLTSTLAIAACRSCRHQGKSLADTVTSVEDMLQEEFGADERFATALLLSLDTATGVLTWVNCGHPPPVLLRDGRWVTTLECEASHPLGLSLGLPLVTCQEQLQPGDRVLLYTDGITEARNEDGQEFGLPRFVDFIVRSAMDGLPVQESLRRLIRSVLAYHDRQLQDDATVMVIEWRGATGRCPSLP
ncbi:hypothetical protein Sme01_50900 [Sphaerisporangium melleum]|uniref:PPM-type phosphatase domain-containing protein n=1 Tax=Sphaerisporangium melleum TaxID=321316 RepID=A0A917VG42_9ACTN|nr:PP2C family protein-serine/threonine phosphatase [Sphaerisporangium melleum]GGK75297.1 hypothetical protein GCM10007964_17650 [Sphaerisporangium melleum]GII72614.1 hypothetical protein Sme01_50900 [Sphaerisporangium melleum]